MAVLRVILWDQLSIDIASLEGLEPKKDLIFMAELQQDCTYVKHHKKKLILLLSAMRHFRKKLEGLEYPIKYIKLDDPENTHQLATEIKRLLNKNDYEKIIFTWPGEYWILQVIYQLQADINIPVEIREDRRFLATREEFSEWAKNRKSLRMEFFYRFMREKHKILLAKNNQPEGGKWNFDQLNRQFPREKINIPQSYKIKPDVITQEVMDLVEKKFADHFGDAQPFEWGVTREHALAALKLFMDTRLRYFGDYQDAMIENEPWMYHSHLSFYINIGLLNPLECIKKAEEEYYKNNLPINAVEGFIRQILGWREYVRGLYWLKMPAYKKLNYFNASRRLPEFYWTAEASMNCLKQCVSQTKKYAYAHHIQRLMVLGNFALLAGLNPAEVNEWYLIVYADAFEWVELPNVTGMILFADGGYLASKPYAAGGAYINKMSNYCGQCNYKVQQKTGKDACPFNYLYWNFLIQHREKLKNNPRLTMIYKTLDKMQADKITQIKTDAKIFLENLQKL